MYIEISGRQTGKTTRLIKSIVDKIEQGYICGLLSHSGVITLIRKEIKERGLDIQNINEHIKIVPNRGVRVDYLFIDEFEYQDIEDVCSSLLSLINLSNLHASSSLRAVNPVYSLLKVKFDLELEDMYTGQGYWYYTDQVIVENSLVKIKSLKFNFND
jgi:hypothetical protein